MIDRCEWTDMDRWKWIEIDRWMLTDKSKMPTFFMMKIMYKSNLGDIYHAQKSL